MMAAQFLMSTKMICGSAAMMGPRAAVCGFLQPALTAGFAKKTKPFMAVRKEALSKYDNLADFEAPLEARSTRKNIKGSPAKMNLIARQVHVFFKNLFRMLIFFSRFAAFMSRTLSRR